MRVLIWHSLAFRLHRGIETLAISLANALIDQGCEVSLLTASPKVEPLVRPDPRLAINAFPTFRYYESLTLAPFYAAHLLSHSYDAVVVFFADFGEGLAWRLVHRLRSIPLVIYLCYPASSVPHRYESMKRLGWHRMARYILADGQWIIPEAEKCFEREIDFLPPGIDTQRFKPDHNLRNQGRSKYGFSEKEIVLLNVSALEHQKGTWRGVQSMARLLKSLPELRYLILGKGEDEGYLRQLVEIEGLGDKVLFAGTTSQLELFYNLADIFVMLPDLETNSVASLEAMSCGLPLLVSNTGGFPDSVPVSAGILVDPNSPEDIDAALWKLVKVPTLRQDLGQVGRKHIVQNFSWGQIALSFVQKIEKAKI